MARQKKEAGKPAPETRAEAPVDTMKYLLNPSTGRVLPASPRLLERSDLIPCSRDGVPFRPSAGRIAAAAERKREIDEARMAELLKLGGAMTESKDTFGAPNNPVASVPAGDAPASDLMAGLEDDGG